MKKGNLKALMRANAAAPRAFRAEAAQGSEATIYLYDIIGEDWWTGEGITGRRFAEALATVGDASTIHLRINSPGGDVFEARAITALMDAHAARFVAHVDGVAASAASFIAARADEVEIAEGAFFMIHNAWTVAVGNKHDLLGMSDWLEKIDDSIANDYSRRGKADKAAFLSMMDLETWLNAEEAIEKGLADRIATKVEPAASNRWDLSAYQKAPAALARSAPLKPEPNDTATAARARALRLAGQNPA